MLSQCNGFIDVDLRNNGKEYKYTKEYYKKIQPELRIIHNRKNPDQFTTNIVKFAINGS